MKLPRKPPCSEVLSARGEQALAGSEDGGGDFGEGEVFGRAAGALFPIEEELAIAVSEAGGGVYVEVGQSAIDPVGGAFEFGVGFGDGIAVDAELFGKGPDRRKRFARFKGAGSSGVTDLVSQLEINWRAGFKVNFEQHGQVSYDNRTVGRGGQQKNLGLAEPVKKAPENI